MSQISKKPIDANTHNRIVSLFISTIISCDNKEFASSLIEELLTPTEKVVLSKRLSIAYMLLEGYNYDEVQHILRVSRSTVGSVNLWINRKGDGLKILIGRIKKDETTKKIWDEMKEGILEIITRTKMVNSPTRDRILTDYHNSHTHPF